MIISVKILENTVYRQSKIFHKLVNRIKTMCKIFIHYKFTFFEYWRYSTSINIIPIMAKECRQWPLRLNNCSRSLNNIFFYYIFHPSCGKTNVSSCLR